MEVSLIDGYDRYSGRLQVRLNSTWGSVCGHFSYGQAAVVCNILFR